MRKQRFFGALAIASVVLLAACPPRDRVDERATGDTIVPATPPEVVPIPEDMRADTPMIADTPMVRDTPQVGAPRVP